MSPLVQVNDVNVTIDNNCNGCCPGLFGKPSTPKEPKKIKISEPRLKTDDKVKKTTCNIM